MSQEKDIDMIKESLRKSTGKTLDQRALDILNLMIDAGRMSVTPPKILLPELVPLENKFLVQLEGIYESSSVYSEALEIKSRLLCDLIQYFREKCEE